MNNEMIYTAIEHIGHVVRMSVTGWVQRLTVQTLTSVCCALEQDTLSALL